MSEHEPRNNLGWRMAQTERRLDRLESHEPSVISERVMRLSADVQNLRFDMNNEISVLDGKIDGMRKVLMGFLLTFAFTGITIVISTVVLLGAGG